VRRAIDEPAIVTVLLPKTSVPSLLGMSQGAKATPGGIGKWGTPFTSVPVLPHGRWLMRTGPPPPNTAPSAAPTAAPIGSNTTPTKGCGIGKGVGGAGGGGSTMWMSIPSTGSPSFEACNIASAPPSRGGEAAHVGRLRAEPVPLQRRDEPVGRPPPRARVTRRGRGGGALADGGVPAADRGGVVAERRVALAREAQRLDAEDHVLRAPRGLRGLLVGDGGRAVIARDEVEPGDAEPRLRDDRPQLDLRRAVRREGVRLLRALPLPDRRAEPPERDEHHHLLRAEALVPAHLQRGEVVARRAGPVLPRHPPRGREQRPAQAPPGPLCGDLAAELGLHRGALRLRRRGRRRQRGPRALGAVEPLEVRERRVVIDDEARGGFVGHECRQGALGRVPEREPHRRGEGGPGPARHRRSPRLGGVDPRGDERHHRALQGAFEQRAHPPRRRRRPPGGPGRGLVRGEPRGERDPLRRRALAHGLVVRSERRAQPVEPRALVGEGGLVDEIGAAVVGGVLQEPQRLHEVAAVVGGRHDAEHPAPPRAPHAPGVVDKGLRRDHHRVHRRPQLIFTTPPVSSTDPPAAFTVAPLISTPALEILIEELPAERTISPLAVTWMVAPWMAPSEAAMRWRLAPAFIVTLAEPETLIAPVTLCVAVPETFSVRLPLTVRVSLAWTLVPRYIHIKTQTFI
jgi:hypothetical protein